MGINKYTQDDTYISYRDLRSAWALLGLLDLGGYAIYTSAT